MIEFTRSEMTNLVIHYVGNKGLGEELTFSDKEIKLNDDFTKDTLMRYLTTPFKSDMYYKFKSTNEMYYHDVHCYVAELFKTGGKGNFIKKSKEIATVLYNNSIHPKIRSGEFYVCYFRDCLVDGVVCDAVGLFKTEKKDTYLKVFSHDNNFDIENDNGINVSKLDKGCLIFNTETEDGYKISVVDNNNKVAECSFYWVEDFLNTKLRENSYLHTSNFIDTCVGFCEEILTESNNVSKEDKNKILNTSVGYFKEHTELNVEEFKKEILISEELQEAFVDYRTAYNDRMDITPIDNFEISATAIKKNQKYLKSVVKLDKNFHIYIHSHHDNIEKGYDEEKGMKYYKLYYINDEV